METLPVFRNSKLQSHEFKYASMVPSGYCFPPRLSCSRFEANYTLGRTSGCFYCLVAAKWLKMIFENWIWKLSKLEKFIKCIIVAELVTFFLEKKIENLFLTKWSLKWRYWYLGHLVRLTWAGDRDNGIESLKTNFQDCEYSTKLNKNFVISEQKRNIKIMDGRHI